MKIAFYKAKHGTFLDKLIATLTFSQYSHCEIIFDDGTYASSSVRDGGVRMKEIVPSDKWDIFELKNICPRSAEQVLYWFCINDGDSYDWLGALGSLFRIDLTTENKKFCSYCCAITLGLDPITTPGRLFRTLKRLDMIE